MSRGHLVALLGLPKLGPRRLQVLLDILGTPEAAWDAVRHNRVDDRVFRAEAAIRPELVAEWSGAAATVDAESIVPAHLEAGIEILAPDSPDWPRAFRDDPEPPPLVFVRGDPSLLSLVSTAIVGTRRCTAAGRSTARSLGEGLSDAGVGVVSGLALGIDGAAHEGALRAGGPAVGVVATGLDTVYPRRHRDLWDEVAERGVLVSEAPMGTAAERWRFPSRNRLIAALSRLVVVVESGRTGGSMLTVDSAIERQVEVGAVPGSVHAPTSAGPNQLLADGCAVIRDVDDVLVALGVALPPAAAAQDGDSGAEPTSFDDDPVAGALAWTPTSLDDIVASASLPFAEVAARLTQLELSGSVLRVADGYQWRPR